jgi:hypothetical protein
MPFNKESPGPVLFRHCEACCWLDLTARPALYTTGGLGRYA